ncbi:DUF488 domain-containing protein [Pseudidiomarina gelatinasegens]|uniref:DUF488 domain-containing protein n=1 Tax=Pseudidiomarina gelatinasegens TaxID=2487740 RepID=UPI0030EC489A
MAAYFIQFKRVYDAVDPTDGERILVDRLWPRGIKKEQLTHSIWCKEACPSNQLRKQYHARDIDYSTFAKHYFSELESHPDALIPIMQRLRAGPVTLLSAVKQFEHSHLPVLKHAVMQAIHREDQQADGNEFSSAVCFGKDFNYWG